MERYSVSLRIQFECEEIRTRITSNTDTFYAVDILRFSLLKMKCDDVLFGIICQNLFRGTGWWSQCWICIILCCDWLSVYCL